MLSPKKGPQNNTLRINNFTSLADGVGVIAQGIDNYAISADSGISIRSGYPHWHDSDAYKYAFIASCSDPKYSTTSQGNKMSIDVNAIVNLAGASQSDEFSKYDELPDNIKEALKRKMADREAARVEAAADSIVAMLDRATNEIQERVHKIRAARTTVDLMKGQIDQIERAKAYGMKTQNFVPLLALLGYYPMSHEKAQIPEDFKVEVSVARKTVKK